MNHLAHPTTSREWHDYYDLRWRILRAPWNQPRGSERDERESESEHLAVFDDQRRMIGVGRLHFNSPQQAQIRFMAVEADSRSQGVGREMVLELERIATEKGATTIVLNAREAVVEFYQKLGYEVRETGPLMFGAVRHCRMEKSL
jgi:predicted GNAT family N-acyltransferase